MPRPTVTHPPSDDPIILDDAFLATPEVLYRTLRTERPVAKVITPLGIPAWLVTRYDDARAALADPRLSKDGANLGRVLDRHGVAPANRLQFAGSLAAHMLNSDPPDHTRLRRRVQEIADELADAMAAADHPTVDLIDAYAFPLPMTVICELLGVPADERDAFRSWSGTLLSVDGPAERQAAGTAMLDYLTRLVAAKRADPGDDILSAIVQATEDADRLSPQEATAMAFLLLVAGHETTVNLIGNGMLVLLQAPDQLRALRADPNLVTGAVEEFLRIDGPVNLATIRHTTEPVTIAGTTIPAGEVVFVSLLAANRDPGRFARPDELDITRDTSGHLAFGHGIHHCLGAPLARLEGEIAVRTLLARFPHLRLAEPPEHLHWRRSTIMHGLTRLPVHVR